MRTIEGWVVWNAEAWFAEYSDIYLTKEQALEAASKHYSYLGDEVDEDCVCKVSVTIH